MLVMQASSAGSLVGERMAKPEFDAGTSLRRIQDQGVIRVGVVADAPGFSSRNLYTRRFEGLDVSIARKLVQSIFGGTMVSTTRNIEFVEVPLTGRVSALTDHRVDVVASVFMPTTERRRLVDFTDAYYGTAVGLVGRRDSPVTAVEDLSKTSIALTPGTVDATLIDLMGLSNRVVECSGNDDNIKTVLSGEADVGVMASVLIDAYERRNADLKRLPFTLDSFPYAIGVQKGDEDLRSFFNFQVGELLRQGFVSLAEMVRRRENLYGNGNGNHH